ncbi:ArsR/SmtB family transcription factor [Novosphingobium bradum]
MRTLSALAQEHRLAAFRLLVQAGRGGMAAGEIVEALGIGASSASFHLAQLVQAGLATQSRHGRSIRYAADYAAMGRLVSYLVENCSGGEGCGEVPGCCGENALELPAICLGPVAGPGLEPAVAGAEPN